MFTHYTYFDNILNYVCSANIRCECGHVKEDKVKTFSFLNSLK